MIQLTFVVTFLSDVVLNAHTATEGQQRTLDYIPGSNFLGIAASKLYCESSEANFRRFHSGEVRFGDAHPSVGSERAMKAPAAWFHPKGGKLAANKNYVQSEIPTNYLVEELIRKGVQLKQVRVGYFLPMSGLLLRTAKSYSIKSAHDATLRRSKEGAMYGYESLAKGSEWIFTVELEESAALFEQDLLEALCGVKRLGRSRSAEYGSCSIELLNRSSKGSDTPQQIAPGEHFLYMASDGYFTNAYGEPTLQPDNAQLGLPEGCEILWEKSQIRSRLYAPYNFKRRMRDADRLVVEKGSVIKFRNEEPFDATCLSQGVGGFRNEGFGSVRIDPDFLRCNEQGLLHFKLTTYEPEKEINTVNEQQPLVAWLMQQQEGERAEDLMLAHAFSFLEKNHSAYKGISSSQWGGIRSIASRAKTTDELEGLLFRPADSSDKKHVSGYLEHGVAAELWREKRRGALLREFIEERSEELRKSPAFSSRFVARCVELLAATMQKQY